MKFWRLKHTLLVFCALFVWSITVPAQVQLPPLPVDKRIQKGTLPCGVTYYMVTDPAAKGYADIAVVRRDEPLSSAHREDLQSAFFGRMGIAPGPEGFLSDWDGSTVYHYRDIPFYRPEVLDSTLLYTFSQMARSRAQQAVIVSGDIDAVELKKKMDIFSMLVPRMLVRENHTPDYVWEPSPAPVVHVRPDGETEVSVTYSGARIPFDYMNTAQAIVTDIFGREFLSLLQHRLERNFRDAGLPYGEIGFRSLRSGDYGGDERYTVYVRVKPERLDPAMRVISSTLGEMDAFGVAVDEFREAKQSILPDFRRRAAEMPSAGSYVNRCIANFLYGANLAPVDEALRFFARKNVADSTETRLFNDFADALLEQLSNLTLEFRGAPDSLDHDAALFYYNLAYLYGSIARSGKDYSWRSQDTLGLKLSCPRVKIRSEKKEAVTGGTLWTFSNGMKVVFKRVKGSGMFSYAWHLNGGLAQIPDLQEGEGGYMGDMLLLSDAGGLPAATFRDLLLANGISMLPKVGLHSLSVSGHAPSDRFLLLVKSFLALANSRAQNVSEFNAYYQRAQLVPDNLDGKLSRLLHPGYRYGAYKKKSALSQQTWQKAEQYFQDRFSRVNDGTLILAGDLDEDLVKRVLQQYLGGFRVLRGNLVRKVVEMPTLSGVSTHREAGDTPAIHVLMDAEYALNLDHFYTAQVAVPALKLALVRALAGSGYSPEVTLEYTAQPQERFQLLVSCTPLPREALPSDVLELSEEQVMTRIRSAIAEACTQAPDAADLKAWKARLEADAKALLSLPDGFVTTLLARYSANKDMTSRYQEGIAGISAAGVQQFLSTLSGGGRIEYIVK